jgi:hypothetical protein
MKNPNLIKEIYNDIEKGFTSANKLYKKLKVIDKNITMKDVKEFYQQQAETEIIKPVSKMKYTYNSITARYAGDIYEIDILVYNRFEQHKQKYILVVIDIYSRFVQAVSMSSREMSKVIPKLVEIIKVMGAPYKIKADNEFDNKYFNKLMNDLHVKTSFSDPYEVNKNAIVERFNKTLALNLKRIRLSTKNNDWPSYLKKVVDNYNNTYHETTKHSPDDIFNKGMFNEQTVIRVIPNLNVGDNVRKILEKKTFSKGDRNTHSTEVYKILKIEKGRYLISDDTDRLYKYYELLKTKTEPKNIEPKKPNIKVKKVVEIETREKSKRTKTNKRDDDYEY